MNIGRETTILNSLSFEKNVKNTWDIVPQVMLVCGAAWSQVFFEYWREVVRLITNIKNKNYLQGGG